MVVFWKVLVNPKLCSLFDMQNLILKFGINTSQNDGAESNNVGISKI